MTRPEWVKDSGIGGFGRGSLKNPRQWQGAAWLGLTLGVPSSPRARQNLCKS